MLQSINWRLITLSIAIVLTGHYGFSQTEDKSVTDTSTSQIEVVELTNLSKETNRLNEKIKRANNYLSSLIELQKIDLTTIQLENKLVSLDSQATAKLVEDPSIRTLRELEELRLQIDKKVVKQEEKIQGIFSSLESHKMLLDEENEKWKRTIKTLVDPANKEVIEKTLAVNIENIEAVLEQISDSTTVAFEINNRIISSKSHLLEVETTLKKFEEDQLSGLFTRDQPAIWNVTKSPNDTLSLREQAAHSWGSIYTETIEFIGKNSNEAIFHLILFVLFLAFFYYVSINFSSWEAFQKDTMKATIQFISRPFWAATFVGILVSNWIYKGIPVTVKEFNTLLLLVPLIILLPQILSKKFHVTIFLLAITFFFDQLNTLIGNFELTRRWIVMIEGVIALVGFIHLYRNVSSNLKMYYKQQPLFTSFFPLAIIAILLLIAAIVGNIRGNTAFAFYVVRGVVSCSVAMFLFFALVSMGQGLLTLLFHGKIMQKSNIIFRYKESLTKYSLLILKGVLTLVWTKIVLIQFGLYSTLDEYQAIINDLSWKFGSVTFTLGHLWDAILVLIAAWFIGLSLKVLLEDEILPRFSMKRGLPVAIGVSTRYFVLTMGFFLAVASLGIDLNKLSFIAGALSVGIGFGLQNIVGNFISGLILLFERPIVAGDIIVMGELDGVVLEIGLRASKVKTWDGAEVIVPNGDLITKQVTNLTLTDKNRRREIILETEKDADPRDIIMAIHSAIILNQEVLSDPTPQVLFKGQFQNYYRFRILYWVTGNILVVGSEISLRINETLNDMNVRIAIPESRVNLSDSEVKPTTGK
ncbi:MAG: hypothetical protein CL840_08220 [Crocinitomicaceae bacterium]|nr:hypothetical protein [Crocinitomicaceae bacterium]|tara:strand:+ start:28803 stop:31238 length:2436 start_codon:yes stop_codon:yes gene_type:complete